MASSVRFPVAWHAEIIAQFPQRLDMGVVQGYAVQAEIGLSFGFDFTRKQCAVQPKRWPSESLRKGRLVGVGIIARRPSRTRFV